MKIGFIGAGQMATALALGMVNSKFSTSDQIQFSDPNDESAQRFVEKITGAKRFDDNGTIAESSDLVFLAVKPQYFSKAAESINLANTDATVISVMAGISLDAIATKLNTQRIIRVMPNTPCLIGSGVCAMTSSPVVSDEIIHQVKTILESIGICVTVTEPLLDAVTGVSGSGPAYVFQFIEALADGGVQEGLPRDVATRLAAQTVKGAAEMVLQLNEHPAVLKDKVASPGGTTIRGIAALKAGGFAAAVMAAVEESSERSRELGLE